MRLNRDKDWWIKNHFWFTLIKMYIVDAGICSSDPLIAWRNKDHA